MYGISIPGMGTYPPGVRWLHESQPVSNQPMGLGFTHRARRYGPGDRLFRPRFVGFVDDGNICDPGTGPYPPRLPLASRAPANQQSDSGVGFLAPCGAVPTRGITDFVPGLLDLKMYERIFYSGMGTHSLRVCWLHEPQLISNQPV